MSEKRNQYSEYLVTCYSARIHKNQTRRSTLWAIITDGLANVNYRVAALRAWVDSLDTGGDLADACERAAEDLYLLAREADGQGAHALADIAWDLAYMLDDSAADAREWAACNYDPNTYYGTPRGY